LSQPTNNKYVCGENDGNKQQGAYFLVLYPYIIKAKPKVQNPGCHLGSLLPLTQPTPNPPHSKETAKRQQPGGKPGPWWHGQVEVTSGLQDKPKARLVIRGSFDRLGVDLTDRPTSGATSFSRERVLMSLPEGAACSEPSCPIISSIMFGAVFVLLWLWEIPRGGCYDWHKITIPISHSLNYDTKQEWFQRSRYYDQYP